MKWLSPYVLAVELGGSELASRLGRFCLSLEEHSQGRSMSNIGGFQSENFPSHVNPALSELMCLLHEPLAAFLWRRRQGIPPGGLSSEGLWISSRPEHIWANINRPGHHNRAHEHGPPLLSRAASGIFYPSIEDATVESGASAQSRLSPPAPVRFYDGRFTEVIPRAGLLLVFPTDLLHEVDPVWPGGSPRASIAFNLFVRWLDLPILRAAVAGDSAEIKRLVAEGADVDATDGVLNFGAVHLAAEAGHLPALQTLLALEADASIVSLEGWSPLGLASAQGHLHIVKYLASQLPAISPDRITFTREAADAARLAPELDLTRGFAGLDGALAVAAERGHESIVEFLSSLADD